MELVFGAISPKIGQQLKKQKLLFDKDTVDHFDKDSDAICRLKIRGLLNDSQGKQANDKLFKKITVHVKAKNKIY